MSSRVILRSGTTAGLALMLPCSSRALRCLRERAVQTRAATRTSTTTTIDVRHPRPVARAPASRRTALQRRAGRRSRGRTTPTPMSTRAGEAEARRSAPRPLSGSIVSCLAYAITSSRSSRTVCCGLSATRLQSGRAARVSSAGSVRCNQSSSWRDGVSHRSGPAQRGAGIGSGALGWSA